MKMHPKKLKQVIVVFEDGTQETHHIDPADTEGFFRQRYTYQQEDVTKRVLHKLEISEIFWAKKVPHDPKG